MPDESAVVSSDLDRLLTDREAAEYLQASPSTLNHWRVLRKGPPYLKLGRHVRYRRSDLLRWIESNIRHTSDSKAAG